MWLLILAGLLTVSAAKETISSVAEKTEAAAPAENVDDIVMLEIDVKEPVKRSPIQTNTGYSLSQFSIKSADNSQELSPEYLSLLQQYTHVQPQQYTATTAAPAPQRRPLPPYAKQQQALQQAYYNYRKPAVVPPRPRSQLHPQALARAEAIAQAQAHAEVQSRNDAIHLSASPTSVSTYQVPAYSQPKLGTFEQELLQLVSANQAQEFKLLPTQPKSPVAQSPYSQQLVSYQPQYAKSTPAPPQQYHIETTVPRYHQQQVSASYQAAEDPAQYQKAFRPSTQYEYQEDPAQAQAEAEAVARAQAQAQAQALEFQKVAQAAHKKHQQDAFEQIRIVNERYRQQTALEQIQQGAGVSDAGRAHIEEEINPKDPEANYRAQLKAQAVAQLAEARRIQAETNHKAHADAIKQLQAQQQAHLKAQEDAHNFALNFEKNQLQAQAHAQAVAQAQAEALYKVHQQARAKANSEVQAVARAQQEARKLDPEHAPVVQFLLPNNAPLPSPNSYFTNDEHKYQGSGSSYVPRAVPKPDDLPESEEQAYAQPVINQPRQLHKLKIPASSQSSIYVSQSGLLKKAPVKSLTIEEVIEQDQANGPQVVRIPASKGQALTQEEVAALVSAGYSVTPVPQVVKPTQPTYVESSSAGYYLKKQKPTARTTEYVSYEEQRPRRLGRKNRQKQDENEEEASDKSVTYLVPLEPTFGTRQPPLRRND